MIMAAIVVAMFCLGGFIAIVEKVNEMDRRIKGIDRMLAAAIERHLGKDEE